MAAANLSALLISALLMLACAPDASAAPAPRQDRFEQLRVRDLRVARVGYELAIANAAQCRRLLTPQLGFVLHSIEQYGPENREEAARAYGLGLNVGVMAVVPQSAAAAAGLRASDALLSVNGRDLDDGLQTIEPTRARVERVERILVEELAHAPVTLRVSGADGTREIQFSATQGCPSKVELASGSAINAWADGTRVIVSDGLLARCPSDDDLALVMAHELAHNLLHHRRRLAADGIAANTLLPMGEAASQEIRDTEEEADRTGVQLAMAAGYDLTGAADFMVQLLDRNTAAATTHPDAALRISLLGAAIEEVRRGEPRTPFSE